MINWKELLQIENDWIEKYLIPQISNRKAKLNVRGYTLKFSGTTNDFKAFAQGLGDIISNFHYSADEIEKLGQIRAHREAGKIFGDIDINTDGKYGELVLYAFVESILECPMIAHKVPTGFNDQVKGGDGIFIGQYEYIEGNTHQAILIGESKVWQNFSSALDDSLDSVNRFHASSSKGLFRSQEFIVAKKGIVNHSTIPQEAIKKHLTPGESEYSNSIIVHPIFIMYDTNKINTIEEKAVTPSNAEDLIKTYILKRHQDHEKLIIEKLDKYPDLKKIYLDFFIVPVKDVNEFREELYFEIHGIKYSSKNN